MTPNCLDTGGTKAPSSSTSSSERPFHDQSVFGFTTPELFLHSHPTHQVATPAASSWGEKGYWSMWLNEQTGWIYPHLRVAQERMTELANACAQPTPPGTGAPLRQRAVKQAARELLLAQASDWPFILRTGTSPGYARSRIETHLSRFGRLYKQITTGNVDFQWLAGVEQADNLFSDVNVSYWCS